LVPDPVRERDQRNGQIVACADDTASYQAHVLLLARTDDPARRPSVTGRRDFYANYAPSMSAVQPASQPAWYIVRGPAAPG